MGTFGSAGIARSTAPQVVSAIAEIELPTNQWSELIPTLLDNVTNQESALQRQASLQTLGYICESTVSYLSLYASWRFQQILTFLIILGANGACYQCK